MWILLAFCLLLFGEGFVLLPPIPIDILGGEHIHDDWQQYQPTEACPVAPCYPNYKSNIYRTPHSAGNPTFGGDFCDSIVKTFHIRLISLIGLTLVNKLLQKTRKGTKKKRYVQEKDRFICIFAKNSVPLPKIFKEQ